MRCCDAIHQRFDELLLVHCIQAIWSLVRFVFCMYATWYTYFPVGLLLDTHKSLCVIYVCQVTHQANCRYVSWNTYFTICELCMTSERHTAKIPNQVCHMTRLVLSRHDKWHTCSTVSMPSDIHTLSTSCLLSRIQAFSFDFIYQVLSFCVAISQVGPLWLWLSFSLHWFCGVGGGHE